MWYMKKGDESLSENEEQEQHEDVQAHWPDLYTCILCYRKLRDTTF